MAKRYSVTVSRVDHGSINSGFPSLHAAWACAEMAAFSLGGSVAVNYVRDYFREARRRGATTTRMTWEPADRHYSITILGHD